MDDKKNYFSKELLDKYSKLFDEQPEKLLQLMALVNNMPRPEELLKSLDLNEIKLPQLGKEVEEELLNKLTKVIDNPDDLLRMVKSLQSDLTAALSNFEKPNNIEDFHISQADFKTLVEELLQDHIKLLESHKITTKGEFIKKILSQYEHLDFDKCLFCKLNFSENKSSQYRAICESCLDMIEEYLQDKKISFVE